MMWGYGVHPGWLWLYGLLSLATLVAVIVMTVRVFRSDASGSGGPPGPGAPGAQPRRSDARRILDERFARGELTAEQYRAQVAQLGE
jgi:putative membrane protein